MKINVSAGHNPDGKKACGAVGVVKESVVNREIKNRVFQLLKAQGHDVVDSTEDNGTSAGDVLTKCVRKDNAHSAEITLQFHLNSCVADYNGDGKTTGVECLIYSEKARETATRICEEIAKLGYHNRGVKINQSLYFLRKTSATAILVECFFCDDLDDAKLYNVENMSQAIVRAVTGQVDTVTSVETPKVPETKSNDFAIPSLRGYKGFSIVGGLKSFGYDSSMSYRKKVWSALGHTAKYKGSSKQNTLMLNELKAR